MKLFKRKNNSVKKWHSRAMIVDLSKTKVIFVYKKDSGTPLAFEEVSNQKTK
jgi:hypothetical protein